MFKVVPQPLRASASAEEYMQQLPQFDSEMARERQEAEDVRRGCLKIRWGGPGAETGDGKQGPQPLQENCFSSFPLIIFIILAKIILQLKSCPF